MRGLLKLRKGVSLVEVLVAMVILLLGIFSMVRLFPTGFTTILYGRNVSEANALTHGIIEAARQNWKLLPDLVEAFTAPNGRSVGLPNPALPIGQELALYQPNPNQPPDPRFSDINQARHVIGETTPIPAPTISSPYMPGVPVSVYLLQFGPIYSDVPTKIGLGGIDVYAGNALKRVDFDGLSAADLAVQKELLDGTNYGIDYQNAVLYFHPVKYARQFKMDYTFTVPTGGNTFVREQAPPGNSIVLPANLDRIDLRQAQPSFFPVPHGAMLETNGEALYRSFIRLLDPNVQFSSDPYEYRVLNPVIGLLGFNPLGATVTAAGVTSGGIIAKIDYDVDDWHIIHEDREVPTATPHQVNLTLNGIEQIGDVNEYQEPYTALMTDYPDRPSPTQGLDVLVVDTETGLTVDNRTLQPLNGAATMTNNGTIDYRNGQILFNDVVLWELPNGNPAQAPIAGKRIRIYYRTPQDWGVQLTKAATTFYLNPNFVQTGLGYREYGVGTRGYLFFPVQDHDQAVLVDYTWVEQEPNGQEVTRTETGEYHQILDPTDALSPQNLYGAPANDWWLQVDGAQRSDAVTGSVRVQRVRGVSVRARAIWREGTRWRSLNLDSFVGRDQGT